MKSGGLFAGYGGLDMAVAGVFGAEPAWFSEIEDAPSKILAHHWPDVPNHGDITQIDWDQVESVDILSGGFPCQDVSLAGKRAGMTANTRSGLWSYFAAGIAALRPRYVVIENVRGLLSAEAHSDVEPCPWCLGDGPGEPALRALGAVLADLAGLGYDAQWCGLPAAAVGAPHGRYRIFVFAQHSDSGGRGKERLPGVGRPVGSGRDHPRDAAAPADTGADLARDAQVRGWDGARPEVGGGESTRPARGSGLALAHAASRGADAAQQRRSGEGSLAGSHSAADPGNDGCQGRTESNSRPIRGLPAPLGHDLDGCGHAATDTSGARCDGGAWSDAEQDGRGQRQSGEDLDRRHAAAADTASNGRHEGRPEPAGELWGPDASQRGTATDPRGGLNAYATEDRPGQDVRELREGVHSAPVRKSTRGQVPLPLATPLLAGMREHEASGEQGREPLASPQAQGSSVRGVLGDHPASRSSQGPEPREQRPGEPSDAMRLLSPEAALAGRSGEATCGCAAWGQFAPAIHRWERILGRLAPEPTQVGPKGTRRLSPLAVEFMMGLPAGHVTAVPGVNRNAQLKALGNGVVPQQAIAALRHMYAIEPWEAA